MSASVVDLKDVRMELSETGVGDGEESLRNSNDVNRDCSAGSDAGNPSSVGLPAYEGQPGVEDQSFPKASTMTAS